MTKELNIAGIGCGSLGRLHSEVVSRTEGARMYAFASRDIQKAKQFCADFSGEYYTNDIAKVMQDPRIDAVLITTWHDTHAQYSIQAAQQGKHVFIEKPMAMTIAECDTIRENVAQSRIKYMVAFRCRFARGTRDLKKAIPHPQVTIAHCRSDIIWAEQFWAQHPRWGGGQVLSQACHLVDLMYYFNESEPVRLYAVGGKFNHGQKYQYDTVNASVQFANGAVGSFIAGDGGDGGLGFFVEVAAQGKSGRVQGHGEEVYFPNASDGESKTYGLDGTGIKAQIPAFIQSIQKNTEPAITAKDGARATIFILKSFESIRTGKVQELQI